MIQSKLVKRYCIIVAGGIGRRMGSEIPKQFIMLGDKPILMHAIERFTSFDPGSEIIVVLPEEHIPYWRKLVEQCTFTVSHIVVPGGRERYFSVKSGLSQTEEESLIAIHDGVRPLVSHETISRCFAEAEKYGMAIPFIEPSDSVRIESDGKNSAVARNEIRLIQTPQVFRGRLLHKAYEQPYSQSFTDDASVAEAAGFEVHLTPGNRENIKITTPEDIIFAKAFIAMIASSDEKH